MNLERMTKVRNRENFLSRVGERFFSMRWNMLSILIPDSTKHHSILQEAGCWFQQSADFIEATSTPKSWTWLLVEGWRILALGFNTWTQVLWYIWNQERINNIINALSSGVKLFNDGRLARILELFVKVYWSMYCSIKAFQYQNIFVAYFSFKLMRFCCNFL